MDNVRKETYVEFLSSGLVFVERLKRPVRSRDVSKVKVPKNAYGFEFFDILSVEVSVDGKKSKLKSKRANVSPLHYYGGKVYMIAELKRYFPAKPMLVKNARTYGCKRVIRNRFGEWMPFEKTDILVEAAF